MAPEPPFRRDSSGPGDVDAGVAEPDDVRPAVTRRVGQEPRMLVHAPAPRVVAEVGGQAPWRRELAVGALSRHVDAGVAEPDDVRPAVTRRVGQEPRMLVHAPAPRVVAEIVDQELWRVLEGPVAVVA